MKKMSTHKDPKLGGHKKKKTILGKFDFTKSTKNIRTKIDDQLLIGHFQNQQWGQLKQESNVEDKKNQEIQDNGLR